jgi:hypothetical protein
MAASDVGLLFEQVWRPLHPRRSAYSIQGQSDKISHILYSISMFTPTYILRRYIPHLEQEVVGMQLAVQQPVEEMPVYKVLALENTELVDKQFVDKASVVQECVDKESVDKESVDKESVDKESVDNRALEAGA